MKKIIAVVVGCFLTLPALAQLQTVRTYDVRIVLKIGDGLNVFETLIHPVATLTSEACAQYRRVNQSLQTSTDTKMSKANFDQMSFDTDIYNHFFYAFNKAKVFNLVQDFFYPLLWNESLKALASENPQTQLGKQYSNWKALPEDRKKIIQTLTLNPDMPQAEEKIKTLSQIEFQLYSILSSVFMQTLFSEYSTELQERLILQQDAFTQNVERNIYAALKDFMKNTVVSDCNQLKL